VNGKLARVNIPLLYEEKMYADITAYIKEEKDVLLKAYQAFKAEFPFIENHF